MDTAQKIPLSVVIIAKNEEQKLPDCLKSVAWAREIIVVDDESSDRTVEIARTHEARVINRKMDIEVYRHNHR